MKRCHSFKITTTDLDLIERVVTEPLSNREMSTNTSSMQWRDTLIILEIKIKIWNIFDKISNEIDIAIETSFKEKIFCTFRHVVVILSGTAETTVAETEGAMQGDSVRKGIQGSKSGGVCRDRCEVGGVVHFTRSSMSTA
jgi:hypothetical protein